MRILKSKTGWGYFIVVMVWLGAHSAYPSHYLYHGSSSCLRLYLYVSISLYEVDNLKIKIDI